jgi:hypothetical protein
MVGRRTRRTRRAGRAEGQATRAADVLTMLRGSRYLRDVRVPHPSES